METPILVLMALAVALAVVMGAVAWSKEKAKIESVTIDGLLKAAQLAVDRAQSLADDDAHDLDAAQATLAANRDRIAKARQRLAGAATQAPAKSQLFSNERPTA